MDTYTHNQEEYMNRMNQTARSKFDLLQPYLAPGISILDFGSGYSPEFIDAVLATGASHTWRHRLNVPNTTSRLTFYGHRDIRNDLYMDDERVFEDETSDTETVSFIQQFLNTIETLNIQR